jgi:hypothetical protein
MAVPADRASSLEQKHRTQSTGTHGSNIALAKPDQRPKQVDGEWSGTVVFRWTKLQSVRRYSDNQSCKISINVENRNFSKTIDDCGEARARAWLSGVVNEYGEIGSAALVFGSGMTYPLEGNLKRMAGVEESKGEWKVIIELKRQ